MNLWWIGIRKWHKWNNWWHNIMVPVLIFLRRTTTRSGRQIKIAPKFSAHWQAASSIRNRKNEIWIFWSCSHWFITFINLSFSQSWNKNASKDGLKVIEMSHVWKVLTDKKHKQLQKLAFVSYCSCGPVVPIFWRSLKSWTERWIDQLLFWRLLL